MIRAFSWTMLLAIAGWPCLAAEPPPTFSSLAGVWTVDRLVGAAPITADQKAADAALGTKITISPDQISTYQKSGACKPRTPQVFEVDTEAKLDTDFGIKGASLDLPAGSLKPRMSFLDAGCAFALVIDANTLLWPMGTGYFYTARREHP